MKKLMLPAMLALFLIFTTSCKDKATDKIQATNLEIAAKNSLKIADLPVMTFSKVSHDFGTINEGEIVKHPFTFTNTGNAPLVIISAKGSCGCTVSDWPKEPIAPGAVGTLLVTFNSNGKPNLQTKQVTITANTEKGKETLKIKAMVTPKHKAGR